MSNRILSLILSTSLISASSGMPQAITAAEPRAESPAAVSAQRTTLFGFDGEGEPNWYTVNDGVMGGVSTGEFERKEGIGIFRGDLSLANNGGFSSCRSSIRRMNLTECDSLVLRVRGDGREYGVNIRTDNRFDGVYYQAKILPPAGEWVEIEIPLLDFRPVWRGARMSMARRINLAEVQSFGFIISDKNEGAFRLEIDEISVTRRAVNGQQESPSWDGTERQDPAA